MRPYYFVPNWEQNSRRLLIKEIITEIHIYRDGVQINVQFTVQRPRSVTYRRKTIHTNIQEFITSIPDTVTSITLDQEFNHLVSTLPSHVKTIVVDNVEDIDPIPNTIQQLYIKRLTFDAMLFLAYHTNIHHISVYRLVLPKMSRTERLSAIKAFADLLRNYRSFYVGSVSTDTDERDTTSIYQLRHIQKFISIEQNINMVLNTGEYHSLSTV